MGKLLGKCPKCGKETLSYADPETSKEHSYTRSLCGKYPNISFTSYPEVWCSTCGQWVKNKKASL
jgi:hypothetical protein